MLENFVVEYPTVSLWLLLLVVILSAIGSAVEIGRAQDRDARANAYLERWRKK